MKKIMLFLCLTTAMCLKANATDQDEKWEKAASECLRHLEDVSRVLVTPHITSIKDVVHSGIDLEGEFSARPNDIVSVTLNSDPFKGIDMNTNELKYYVKSVKYFFTIKGKASEMTLNQLKNCEIIKFEKDSRYNA